MASVFMLLLEYDFSCNGIRVRSINIDFFFLALLLSFSPFLVPSSNRRLVTKMKIFVIKCEFDILLRLVTEKVKRELREFDRDEHSGLY